MRTIAVVVGMLHLLAAMAVAQTTSLRALRLFYSDAEGDNYSTATDAGIVFAAQGGYRSVRNEAYVFVGATEGAVPLKQFYHRGHRDYFTTATLKVSARHVPLVTSLFASKGGSTRQR